jgi:hypothetical protein
MPALYVVELSSLQKPKLFHGSYQQKKMSLLLLATMTNNFRLTNQQLISTQKNTHCKIATGCLLHVEGKGSVILREIQNRQIFFWLKEGMTIFVIFVTILIEILGEKIVVVYLE